MLMLVIFITLAVFLRGGGFSRLWFGLFARMYGQILKNVWFALIVCQALWQYYEQCLVCFVCQVAVLAR